MTAIPPGEMPDVQSASATENCDQQIHDSTTSEGANPSQVNRVVCICLDEASGKDAFYWALQQFIQPDHDLVCKKKKKKKIEIEWQCKIDISFQKF